MPDHSVTKLLFEHLKLYVFNVMGIRRVEEEKIRLPVDVRGSKTSVLKLSIIIRKSARDQGLLVHVTYEQPLQAIVTENGICQIKANNKN